MIQTEVKEDYSHLISLSKDWIQEASRVKYFHALTWLGRTIIQVPQDTYAITSSGLRTVARPKLSASSPTHK